MICNVCGDDTRCYSLVEADMSHLRMILSGMVFNICSECLGKLVATISTDNTKLDDPKERRSYQSIMEKVRQKGRPIIAANVDGALNRKN